MTRRACWRAVAVGLAMLMVQGCATTQHENGRGFALPASASFPSEATLVSANPSASPSADEWVEEAGARRAEVEWALGQMWAVASGEGQVGSVLEFTFWAERGALTLLSVRRRAVGGEAGQPTKAEAFTGGLRELLFTLAETRTGALGFTLHREQSRWRVDYEALPMDAPPEARKLPARRTGYSSRALSAVQAMAKQVVRLLQVPAGASARMRVELSLEDDRLTGWEMGPYHAAGGGTVRPADARVAEALTLTLLPFMRGLGPRTVRLELSGMHGGTSATSHWRVERAETLRPEPVDEAGEDVLREYRLLHAQIFHHYREEMVDSVKLAGAFTLEQVALCVIGGLVGKGLHVAFEAVAPSVMRVATRGGAAGMRWLRTQLVRAGRADQELLRRLFVKVETEGFECLSAAERNELTQLLRRMEQSLTVKLDKKAKDALRAKAQDDFYGVFYPELNGVLRGAWGRYDVHHLIPLEYAHLFPELDINAAANLKALGKPVHEGINRVWNAFRMEAGDKASPEQVQQIAAVTRRHFERWFNKVYEPSQSDALLERATAAALADVRALVAR
ncbi:hypothetical protein [Vitiosangium sp. GDMCC 1.1324]|uniref:hypothetical protein n=1 Tax=Vitiosangium sp. (strain GDMCC 1.1324) TaxID=2138576 RepID=UPI000D35BFF1|nr:hypothetical protein [Vitiosangium sp. GDMCC 1.1324]PTL82778.1 hypothetical protein DAT35_18610 [Vitiosangium sp. GDMCC 1.1324]